MTWHWRVMQNFKKNWLVPWKMTYGIWLIFMRAAESVKIFTLMGFFCPKYRRWKWKDAKVQKSYVSWHWRVMESLKKNRLLVAKKTWGNCWILMRAVPSLKICTLMCYFFWKYFMFEPKKCRGVICHNSEKWCKIWGGTN